MTAPSAPDTNGFHPPSWAVGGHRQTLLGYWCRFGRRWRRHAEDLVVDVGGGVQIVARASWQPGARAEAPALVLIHGLGGCDQSGYIVVTSQIAWSRGWHVVRMNMRGAGDTERACPHLYNAGLDTDVLAVLDAVGQHTPQLAAVGFSLGANLLLLALGRRAARVSTALKAAVAISPPLDLALCADALDRPARGTYRHWFLRSLRASYRRRQLLLPHLYAPGLERDCRTIRRFDDVITARYGGYRDVDDYYATASAGPHLASIDRRVLILAAEDDPLVPAASVARWPLPASGRVERVMTHTGGHMGFVAATRAPGRFWAGDKALAWLSATSGYTGLEPRQRP